MSRCGGVCNLRALRPLMAMISLSGTAIFPARFALGCKLCTLFLGRAGYNSLHCKQRVCSCRRNAIADFTPKRMIRMGLGSNMHPVSRKVLFRPSLVHNASLKRRVGRCSFFSCTSGRTLRLSSSRGGVFRSYLSGMRRRLSHPVSGRDGHLVTEGVRLLLSCYVHFCRHRFIAHSGIGGSMLVGFRSLLSICFRDRRSPGRGLPAIGCFTSGMGLSSGCFNSLVGGRAKGATRRCVRKGVVGVTGREVLTSRGAIDRVTCRLKFRCPRRFAQVFGGIINYAPARCEIVRM